MFLDGLPFPRQTSVGKSKKPFWSIGVCCMPIKESQFILCSAVGELGSDQSINLQCIKFVLQIRWAMLNCNCTLRYLLIDGADRRKEGWNGMMRK